MSYQVGVLCVVKDDVDNTPSVDELMDRIKSLEKEIKRDKRLFKF